MPNYENIDVELTALRAKHTDAGNAWEVVLLVQEGQLAPGAAEQLFGRLKKGIVVDMAWGIGDAPNGSMFARTRPADGAPRESGIGVTCYDKTGKCHSHQSASGVYWHCIEERGKTFIEACAHVTAASIEVGAEEADVICYDCGGTGMYVHLTDDTGNAEQEPCDRCAGVGHGPASAINAAPTEEDEVEPLAGDVADEPKTCNIPLGLPDTWCELPAGHDGLHMTQAEPPIATICGTCGGSGEIGQGKKAKKCGECDGTGEVAIRANAVTVTPPTNPTDTVEVVCDACNGSGQGRSIGDGLTAVCDLCKGSGEILAAPSATTSQQAHKTWRASDCYWLEYPASGWCAVQSDGVKMPCPHVLAAHPNEEALIPF